MDSIDQKILDILKDDGRASYTDVAKQVGVSEGTVRNRVESMMDEGKIEKFTVETSLHGSKAIVMVRVSTGMDIDSVFDKMSSDMSVDEVTGDYDLIIEFKRKTTEELNDQLDQIRSIEGVEETKTYTVLKSRKI